MRRVTLQFCRYKGGPGERLMFKPPPFSRATDPYRQDPQPPHRITPQIPINKTGADKDFMQYQIKQFELGKRHLGNMMGIDSETMTQKEIDWAIRYLFPTALFSKKSRPIMKDPRTLFTVSAQLDVNPEKRPRNPFFYTPNPGFSNLCFKLASAIEDCDEAIRNGQRPENKLPYDPEIQKWKANVKTSGDDDKHFNSLIRRLAVHPMAAMYENFLKGFRDQTGEDSKEGGKRRTTSNDMDGFVQSNPYDRVSVATGAKATARARVELRPCKEGEEPRVTVNGLLLSEHFDYIQDREQVMFPISATKMYSKFHIKATVQGGGRSTQSNSVRLALAKAMVPFLEDNLVETLRLSGLLTPDARKRERQKIGQHGARRKKQFRKR